MGNSCVSSQSVAPAGTTHTVYVRTGDKKGAATDGNIFVRLGDEEGKLSEEQPLDTKWRNDFQKGSTDVFHFKLAEIGRVVEIQIRRDETAADDDWYVQKIAVEMARKQPVSVFPVNRWVHANDTLCLSEFDTSLPQDDRHPEQRAKELDRKRTMYQLTQHIPGGPYQIASLPTDENFSNDYKWDITSMKVKLFAEASFIDLTTPNIDELADFKKMYKGKTFTMPYGAENWTSDEEFGNQRLSGCNPITLRLCTTIPENFAVTEEMVEPFLEGKSLSSCLQKKKMYVVDLSYMAEIKCTAGRKLPGPKCLFYVKDSGHLVPVAIQLMPVPAEDNPVFLPSDPKYTWLAAKMWFNLADSSHHQSATHLGLTHLIMETVATCTHRQLSPSHPMFRLLAPHFIYLLAINTLAVNKLVSEGGWVDEVMHIGREGMFAIIEHNWKTWDLQMQGNLLADLQERGVDDVNALPNYHYRDDAILIWNALHKYISSVVENIYDSADKLIADKEIQAWAKELADSDIKGMPSGFTTQQELAAVFTTFIFIGSAGHAAANFCQYDEYAFIPNYPVKLMGEVPKDKAALTEEYIISCLAPKKEVLSTMIVTKLLSERGTNELTNFEVEYACDPISMRAQQELKEELNRIKSEIDTRNSKRVRKYPYLNPREVPNAISI